MKKAVIYARFSDEMQNPLSVEDQIAVVSDMAKRQGYQIVGTYEDHGISGKSMLTRDGVQRLVRDASSGKFQVVLAESMSRVSRALADIAHLYQILQFNDVGFYTMAEGEVNLLAVGMKGTYNQVQLSDLALQVHRGQEMFFKRGKLNGGGVYGYDQVREFGSDGKPVTGERKINPVEAVVVNRIFREYIGGKSPKAIAKLLNAESIPSPRGGQWGPSTIGGDRKRGSGILNNQMYIGKVVWDRRKNVYDPNTGKRLQRMKDAEKHIAMDFPQYRILDQNIWEAAKAMQGAIRTNKRLQDQRRFTTLFTGLIRCGVCGGGVHRHSNDKYVCFSAKDKGTCTNQLRVKIPDLEHALLYEIENKLMDPALCQVFCDEYTKHMNTVRTELVSERSSYESELKKKKKEDERIVQLALDGFADIGALKEKRNAVLARIAELEALLVETPEIPPLLHPSMGTHYRNKIQKVISQYQEKEGRDEVIVTLRSLVEKIVITPVARELEISVDLYGDIAGILSMATGKSRSSEQVLNMAAQVNTITALDMQYQQETRVSLGAYHVGNLSREIDGAGWVDSSTSPIREVDGAGRGD